MGQYNDMHDYVEANLSGGWLGAGGDTDQEVLDFLRTMTTGRWLDVPALELALWTARYDLNERVEDFLDEVIAGTDGARERVRPLADPGAAAPHPRRPFQSPFEEDGTTVNPNWAAWSAYWLANTAEKDAAFQLRQALNAGQGITSSNSEVRTTLAKLHDRIITTAERDDLLGVARPNEFHWKLIQNPAGAYTWEGVEPNLGDVTNARAAGPNT